jgi:hypothetical protein
MEAEKKTSFLLAYIDDGEGVSSDHSRDTMAREMTAC